MTQSREDRPVLVVDDQPAVRSLVRDVLELSGFSVREAEDGIEALRVLVMDRPQAVVLDVMMPGMSGLDVLATMRRHATLGDVPVILLSAADDDSTTWAGWRAGADCYLGKPFDPDDLILWLRRLSAQPC